MPIKRHKAEQVVTLLRQIEVKIVNGKARPKACKEVKITMQIYCRWCEEYGGLKLEALNHCSGDVQLKFRTSVSRVPFSVPIREKMPRRFRR